MRGKQAPTRGEWGRMPAAFGAMIVVGLYLRWADPPVGLGFVVLLVCNLIVGRWVEHG